MPAKHAKGREMKKSRYDARRREESLATEAHRVALARRREAKSVRRAETAAARAERRARLRVKLTPGRIPETEAFGIIGCLLALAARGRKDAR